MYKYQKLAETERVNIIFLIRQLTDTNRIKYTFFPTVFLLTFYYQILTKGGVV